MFLVPKNKYLPLYQKSLSHLITDRPQRSFKQHGKSLPHKNSRKKREKGRYVVVLNGQSLSKKACPKKYAPNTRETVRRQTVHQFLDAGLIGVNPDSPERPVNSPKTAYQIEESALELLRTYDTSDWEKNVRAYLASVETLKQRYAQEREMARIPITL